MKKILYEKKKAQQQKPISPCGQQQAKVSAAKQNISRSRLDLACLPAVQSSFLPRRGVASPPLPARLIPIPSRRSPPSLPG
jgi:hypothetical protein